MGSIYFDKIKRTRMKDLKKGAVKDNSNKLEQEIISSEINKILELKSDLAQIDDTKGEKDRIIEILREELSLINMINNRVVEEKDKYIMKLEQIIEEKEIKIRVLKEQLKHMTDLPLL